jgi:hypothetical protein
MNNSIILIVIIVINLLLLVLVPLISIKLNLPFNQRLINLIILANVHIVSTLAINFIISGETPQELQIQRTEIKSVPSVLEHQLKLDKLAHLINPKQSKIQPKQSKIQPTQSKIQPTQSKIQPTQQHSVPIMNKLESVTGVSLFDGIYTIQNKNGNENSFLTVNTNENDKNQGVSLWKSTPDTKWIIKNNFDNTHDIQSEFKKQFPGSPSYLNGAHLDFNSDKWLITANTDGTYNIQSNTRKIINQPSYLTYSGNDVILGTFDKASSWYITKTK